MGELLNILKMLQVKNIKLLPMQGYKIRFYKLNDSLLSLKKLAFDVLIHF